MLDCGSEPCSVSVRVGADRHPAVALSLSGQRASLRGAFAPPAGSWVSVHLDWGGGRATYLPSRVRALSASADEHVADLDVFAVEGDWRPFLEYLGPVALAS